MSPKHTWSNWLWHNLQARNRRRLLLAMLLSASSALALLWTLWCMYQLLSPWLSPEPPAAIDSFWLLAALLGAAWRHLAYFIAMLLSHASAFDFHFRMRRVLLEQMAWMPMGHLRQYHSGDVKKMLLEDLDKTEVFLSHYLPDLAAAVVLPLASMALMLWLDWRMALVAGLPLLLVTVFQSRLMALYGQQAEAIQQNLQQMNRAVHEYLRSMPEVKVFNQSTWSFGCLADSMWRHKQLVLTLIQRASLWMSLFRITLEISLLFIVPMGLWLLWQGELSPALLLLFLLIGLGFLEPVNRILIAISLLAQAIEGLKQVQRFHTAAPCIKSDSSSVFDTDTRIAITFQQVSFSHQPNTAGEVLPNCLQDITFNLPTGEHWVVVGASGAGKSSLAQLLLGFWPWQQGEIVVHGQALRDCSTEVLMQHIGFVFQEVFVLNDTLFANLRMARANASEAELLQAAQLAGVAEFAAKLPQGYHTPLGEQGVQLSGGERQRLAWARLLLRDAPIWVLDEADSALDRRTREHLWSNIQPQLAQKTVLSISHQVDWVARADQVLWLVAGRVQAIAPHASLLQHPAYQRLWQQQAVIP